MFGNFNTGLPYLKDNTLLNYDTRFNFVLTDTQIVKADNTITSILKILLLTLLLITSERSVACDVTLGPGSAGAYVIAAGQTACMTGNVDASVTLIINSGGVLRICGVLTTAGSVTISPGALVILTQGTSVNSLGSFIFNEFNTLAYEGDPACTAEIYKTGGTLHTTGSNPPGAGGSLTSSSAIYLDGFTYAWGSVTRGSANLGRSPGVCGTVGSCLPCATATVGGSVTANASVCAGTNGATLTLAGHTGTVQRWESSTDNWTTTTVIANVTTTQAYLNLGATTKYRAVVKNGAACTEAKSGEATITIDPVSVGGTITAAATVCSGANGATLTLAGHTGSILQWESSTDNFTTTTVIANTTTTQAYLNLAATTKYRAVVKSGACANATSAEVEITVDPATVGGTITAAATVCSGTNGATLTLAGHTGSIVRWESSTDNFTNTTVIANVTTTQAYLNLTTTTKYRAVVKSGSCANATSAEVEITVDPATVGGAITAAATVCSGANGATLTLAGHTGSIVRWESSIDNFANTTVIANMTTTQVYSNLTATTKYRAVVQSGSCANVNSTEVTITVTSSVGGAVTADASVCSGANGATLTLAGHTGSIVRWESSIDNFTNTTVIANTSTTQVYSNLTATTKYRAVLQEGACATANSAEATITVGAGTTAGIVTADATVCTGTNGATLTLAGHVGSILRWESSIDNFANTTVIANTTTTQVYANLTVTTKYRALVKSGTCVAANSIEATITVSPVTVGGTITADATVCSGANGATLTLAGYTGSIVRWESSIDNFANTTVIANTTTTHVYANITATTKYRAVVQSGGCANANSAEVTITVDPATVGGTVTADAIVCSGANGATLTLAGHTGSIVRWESSIDNFVNTTVIANTSTTQVYSNLTVTTKYRAVVQSGACANGNSAEATITVDPATVGGTVTADATVCAGANGATLTLAGHTGTIVRWESSTDNFTNTTTIANVTTIQAYLNLGATTKYRAVVASGSCANGNSAEATITVDPATVGGTVTADATVCAGANGATLTLAGHTGTIVRWESSTDNFINTTTIANVTTTQAYLNLAATTKYRAVIASGSCANATSTEATITVDPATVGGTISADAAVCSGSNGATLTLSGHTGAIVRWESSTDNFVTDSNIVNTTTTEAYSNLTVDTKFRVILSSGTCGTSTSAEVTITINPNLTVNLGPNIEFCVGDSATLDASNVGSNYLWSTTETSQTIKVKLAGTYSVIVTNPSGCIGYDTVVVSTNSLPVVALGPDAEFCAGDSIVIDAGNAGSTFLWSTTETGQTVTVKTAIDASVEVTDGNGCVGRDTLVVSVNALPTQGLGIDQAICTGDTVVLDAGNLGSGYVWSDGVTTQLDSVTIAGSYSVIITDAKGCVNNDTVVITENALPVVALGPDVEFCAGDSAVFDAGNVGSNFLWSTTETSQTITVKLAGTYDVRVTDVNGCIGRDTAVASINSLPLVVFGLTPDTYCISEPVFNVSGGSPIAILPSIGIYSGTGITGGVFTAQTAGVGAHNLTYTYTDGNGCTNAATDSIHVLANPVASFTLPANLDSSCSGATVITLAGGSPLAVLPATGVYSGTGVSGGGFDPSGAAVGTHLITYIYTDEFGCADTSTDNIEVLGLPAVICNLADDDLCLTDSPLRLLGAAPTGGVYSGVGMISDTVFDPSISTKGKFELTYTYTDIYGCESSDTDSMEVYALPVVTCDLADDALCADETPLRLLGASPTGGVYSGPGMISDTVFNPRLLTVGNYTLTYTFTDANGCVNTATDDITVDALPSPTLTLGDNDICLNDPAQALSGATPTGGQYSIGGVVTNTGMIDPTNMSDGVHLVKYKYTDANGCEASVSENFTVHPLPNANIGAGEEVCKYLDVVMTVPESGMNYLWNNGGVTQSLQTNEPGMYIVSVTNPVTLCNQTASKLLTQGAGLSVELGDGKQIICEGQPLELNIGAYNKIVWNGDTLQNGTSYTANSTDRVDVLVIDAKGCFGVDTVWTTYVAQMDFTLRTDTSLCEEANDVVLLEIENQGVSIEWNDGSDYQVYEATYSGEYTATITDQFGCQATDVVYLKDSCSIITLTMPNIFTPNYNNINDYMRPIEMEWATPEMIMNNIKYIRYYVYDRWGVMVHASEGRLPKWDGRSPSGLPCSDGVYFWNLEYSDASGGEYNLNGFVKLLRTKAQ